MSVAHIPQAALAGDAPDDPSLAWLLSRGVTMDAIAYPWPVLTARVIFDPFGRYSENSVGEFVFLLPIVDEGDILDVVAWSPRSGRTATAYGAGACLGQGQLGADGRGTTGLPMPVWRSPLRWLQAERHGLVVVDVDRASHVLADLLLQAEDETNAAHLRKTLIVRPPVVTAGRAREAA